MTQSVDEVLRELSFYSDEQTYRILKLPPNAITLAAGVAAEIGAPYCALIADKDEVSLMIPDEARLEYSARLRQAEVSKKEYRLITLDAVLDPELVGLMAVVADALAAAGIAILTFAAFSRDHLFVSNDDLDMAIRTLQSLQKERP